MATTWPIRSMGAAVLNQVQLSYIAQWEPEAASQTYTAGAPVYPASGLLTECADPIDGSGATKKMLGLAIEDGHNATAGRTVLCKFIPAIDGVIFYANLLTGDGDDNAFDVADLFVNDDSTLSSKSGVATSGVTDWFIDDAGATGVTLISTRADMVVVNLPATQGSRVITGDINARVGFVPIAADRTFGQA